MRGTYSVSIDAGNPIWYLRMSMSAFLFAILFGYFFYENPADESAFAFAIMSVFFGSLGIVLYLAPPGDENAA